MVNTLIKKDRTIHGKLGIRECIAHVVLVVTLGIIAILAVPIVIFIVLISIVWSAADRFMKWLNK